MAVKIRLARGGAKKRPYYYIVAADERAPRDGRYLEKIGNYNPLLAKDNESRVNLNVERIKYWLGVGAKPTDKVARFLSEEGLYEWKKSNNPIKGKPGEKSLERAKNKEEKQKALKEATEAAKAAPAEEAAPAVEAAPAPADAAEETKNETKE